MNIRLEVMKNDEVMFVGVYPITDAATFGAACEDALLNLQRKQNERETSIGALMEHLSDNRLEMILDAQINVARAE